MPKTCAKTASVIAPPGGKKSVFIPLILCHCKIQWWHHVALAGVELHCSIAPQKRCVQQLFLQCACRGKQSTSATMASINATTSHSWHLLWQCHHIRATQPVTLLLCKKDVCDNGFYSMLTRNKQSISVTMASIDATASCLWHLL